MRGAAPSRIAATATLAVTLLLPPDAMARNRRPAKPAAGEHAAPAAALAEPACPMEDVTRDISVPGASEPVVSAKKTAWEAQFGGKEAARTHVQARLRGWPQRLLVDPRQLPSDSRAFAWRVARDTWRGLDALTDRENGLPVDHVRFGATSVAPADSRVGDYASGTNIGMYLVAVAAARELGLVSEDEALGRIRRVLDTVEGLETHRGFLFNYYDTTSLERTSHFVSFVDASWFSAGLIVVRMSFPDLYVRCANLLSRTDYRFFLDPKTNRISHGYHVQPGVRSPYDYGALYTEARLGALIGIGKGDLPEQAWYRMHRIFPKSCSWLPVMPTRAGVKAVRGREVLSGFAEYRGLRYLPSWGGSMFEALMPVLLLDEPYFAPDSLGANDLAHATIQRLFALEELGYPVWGISPCATPAGDGYGEYGVRPLGARGYEAGAVTPHASALALAVTPDGAIANLRKLAESYDLYGDFGFYDAVDPKTGLVAHKYLALDQAMLFVALANHLKTGCVQKRFAADPLVGRVLPMLGDEKFFE